MSDRISRGIKQGPVMPKSSNPGNNGPFITVTEKTAYPDRKAINPMPHPR
jgi:hypothetical protein